VYTLHIHSTVLPESGVNASPNIDTGFLDEVSDNIDLAVNSTVRQGSFVFGSVFILS